MKLTRDGYVRWERWKNEAVAVPGVRHGLAAIAVSLAVVTGCASPLRVAGPPDIPRRMASAEQSPAQPPRTWTEYWRSAETGHPGLRAAHARYRAAAARARGAGALDDPALTAEYLLEQRDTRYRAALTQMFPPPGVRSLRARQATAEAEVARYAFQAARLDLYERLVSAFHNYHFLSRMIAVTEAQVRLLADLEATVEERYRAGAAPFAERVQARIERAKLADRLASLQGERRPRSAELAALLGRAPGDVLPWPVVSPPVALDVDEEELGEILEDLNPELRSAAAEIEAADHAAALARRAGWPAFMLGVGGMVMRGMDDGDETDVALMAGVSLPVWRGRLRSGRSAADAERDAARHALDALRNRARADLAMAVYRFQDAERRIRVYAEDLAPQAEQSLAVSLREYAEGRIGFAIVIDAQRALLDLRLLAERASADREIAIGDISCCVGDIAAAEETDLPEDQP